MAKPDVRMNYDSMEKMAKEFDNCKSQLETTTSEMNKIVEMMEGGALLGQGGDAFRDAIQSILLPAIQTLTDKMGEMSGDINAAVAYTRDGVEDSRKKFV